MVNALPSDISLVTSFVIRVGVKMGKSRANPNGMVTSEMYGILYVIVLGRYLNDCGKII